MVAIEVQQQRQRGRCKAVSCRGQMKDVGQKPERLLRRRSQSRLAKEVAASKGASVPDLRPRWKGRIVQANPDQT
jgi:hypothetical protein